MTVAEPVVLDVTQVRSWLRRRPDTVVVDVRSPVEFGVSSIAGSTNLPLDQVDALSRRVGATSRPVVVVCGSGAQATRAAEILGAQGASQVVVLRGGLTAWIESGAPVEYPERPTWALERQVRLVAGGLVASSIAASMRFPRWRYLAGAVGLGLVTAAITDTCAMGELLARLPHNRRQRVDVDAVAGRFGS